MVHLLYVFIERASILYHRILYWLTDPPQLSISLLCRVSLSRVHLYIFSCLSVFGLYAIYFVFLGLSLCLSRCLRYSFLSLRPPLCAYLFYSKINSRSKQATHTLADKSSSWGCAAAAAVWMCVRQVANLLLPLFPNWKQLRILAVFKLNFIPSSCCCFFFFFLLWNLLGNTLSISICVS